MRVDYRWIVFPKAAINGGADSGNSPRGQHQIVSYQRTASGSALDCKEKVGPVVREKSERSREIWGISVLLRGLASGGFYSELGLQLRSIIASRSRLFQDCRCIRYRQDVLKISWSNDVADNAEPHVPV